MKSYSTEIQDFINANLHSDLHSLLLKKSPFPEVPMQEIVQQIKGRKVAQSKFPFLQKNGIIFPKNLNLEQASSEVTANYKSSLVSGEKFCDLTCGFGIDAWFLSNNFKEITLIEQNLELIEIVKNNWKILGRNAKFLNQKLEDFLDENSETFDLIYLDPARRDENKNKVFLLEDLSPNFLEIQPKLQKISGKILMKLSPLIDISYLVSVVENISEIHIVAVKNDVKELLVCIDNQNFTEKIKIICVNLETLEPKFEYFFDEENFAKSTLSEPEKYIYLPNNSLLKSGAFDLISEKFNLKKLHPNTQIFTSGNLVENFPGRVLEMEMISAKDITKNSKFNIISKNYPLKPDEIKKKYKINDGGTSYLIFTQTIAGKIILKSIENVGENHRIS